MQANSKTHSTKRRVRNEAVSLYDMNADETLHRDGYVVIDSSLGLLPGPTTDGAKPSKPSR